MTMTRAVTLSDPNNPMSLLTQTDTVTVNGKITKSVYDNTARTVTTTTPANRQVTASLDAQGRVTSEAVAGLNAVSFAYDSRGRLNGVAQGTRGSSLAYDAQGNLASVTDPIGRTVSFGYDAAGRVVSQTLPDGRSIGFTYDANGNVTSVTPPSRPAHNFAYTPVDLQQSYTPPDVGIGGTTTRYAYNKDRQLISLTRPDGQGVAFAYDAQGKLASMTTPDGTTNLSYDSTKGTLASIETPQGVTNSYAYDGFLPLSETFAGPVNGTVSRTFNSDFKVASVSVNGQNPVSYAYDNDGLLTQAGALTLTRDAQNGLLTATALGNETEGLTYNAYGEQTDFHAAYPAGLDFAVHYDRDGVGRIVTKTETINGTTTTWAYGYDVAGRLSDVLKDGAVYAHYDYDANGNRLDKTNGAGTVLAAGTYDNQDRMLTYGSNSYAYTANGELTAKTDNSTGNVTTYQYDVLGNLKHVNLPDGTAIDYVIDGRNRRIAKKVNGALTEAYIYDGQLRPVAQLDASGNLVGRYVYATHINVPDYMVKDGVTYKIITDHLGSPRFVIDSSTGAIAQRMDYDDFGNVLLDTAPGFTPFGFAGGLYDSQTKLVRFGARDYDAETGRWTSKDPVSFAGGLNLYGYVTADPVNGLDAFGLKGNCPDYMKKFFDRYLKPFEKLAKDLNIDVNYLLALAADEGGWADEHNIALNNPFGQQGGKHGNAAYPSLADALNAWRDKWGPDVQDDTSMEDFLDDLLAHNYNTQDPQKGGTKAWKQNKINVFNMMAKHRKDCEC
jgi:RHS repeat-associated protein